MRRATVIVSVLGLAVAAAMIRGARPVPLVVETIIAPAHPGSAGRGVDAAEQEPAPAIGGDTAPLQADVEAAYLAWFEAIYRRDVDALGSAVATVELRKAGEAAIASGALQFTAVPSPGSIRVRVNEVLLELPDCVVVEMTDDVGGFLATAEPEQTMILVLRGDENLRLSSVWAAGTPSAVWRAECISVGGGDP